MYKAVFIDLDGTLLRKDHSISEETISIINTLQQKGILVVLVSARPLSGIRPIIEKTGLQKYPVASLNGAYILYRDEIIFEASIDAEITSKLYEHLRQYESTPIYYHQDSWFSEVKNKHTDHEQRITSIPVTVQPFSETLSQWKLKNSGPNKILVIADAHIVEELQSRFREQFKEELTICTSKPTYLEIMHNSASKLNAIKMIMNQFDIQQNEVVAIGDNYNDVEMITFAGMGVAMGNAPEAVKNAADFVTDTNNNEGVAKVLVKFFL